MASTSTTLENHFSDPSGDLFLSSPDEFTFRVSRSHLSFASEIFSGMFAAVAPSPNEPDTDGSSTTPLLISDLPGAQLNTILHLIYATGVITHISTPLQVYAVAKFADKYVMDGLTRLLRSTLIRPHLTNDPMSTYMIASSLGWDNEVSEARVEVMRTDLYNAPFKTEWEGLPASHIHALMVSYHRTQAMSRDVLADFISGKLKVFWPLSETGGTARPYDAKEAWFARKLCSCNRFERSERRAWPPVPKPSPSYSGSTSDSNEVETPPLQGFPPNWARVLHSRLTNILRSRAKLTSLEVMEMSMTMGASLSCGDCSANMALLMNVVNTLARKLEEVPCDGPAGVARCGTV